MTNGFYKRRRGILDHLEAGTISLLDSAVHDYLSLKMNAVLGSDCKIPPGVVFTCSKAIHASCPKGISERAIRRSLENLEKIGWIKRWMGHGKRGNYPVLIARGSVHDLAGNEYRVSGEETTDWRSPILRLLDESSMTRPRRDHEASTSREIRRDNREQVRKNPAVKAAPPADLRHAPFYKSAYESFRAKNGQPPTWGKREGKALKDFLGEHKSIALEEWQRRFRNYMHSTEIFTVKQGGSLLYFIWHFDAFKDGPIFDKGGGNGSANTRATGAVTPDAERLALYDERDRRERAQSVH